MDDVCGYVRVIRQIIGTKKTAVFLVLVVAMATVTGMLYGSVAG